MDEVDVSPLTREEAVQESQRRAMAGLYHAIGSRCELRNQDNKLVFLGHVQRFNGTAITLLSAAGRELPPVIFNSKFKLTIRVPGRSAQVWHGLVCGSSPTMWKLDHLECFHYAEQRSSFRQPVSLKANVVRLPNQFDAPLEESIPCRILDISLGGLQLKCRARFEGGTWLRVTDCHLPPDRVSFPFTGQVCWTDLAGGGEFLYGVRFAPMRSGAQDRLCSTIFALQRLDLKAQLAEE